MARRADAAAARSWPPLPPMLPVGCFAVEGTSLRSARRPPLERELPDEVFGVAPARASRAAANETVALDASGARPIAGPGSAPGTGDLPLGTMIEKYRIDGILGSGGFATVYRAKHMLLQMDVAVKLLKSSLLQENPQLAEMLCEEAQFVAQINHPNVVRVFDITSNEQMTYIVMEYIEGATLAEAIETGALEPRDALAIALDVCAGLSAGLAKGLIHRDVKPGNVMVGKDAKARILDFGLARPVAVSPTRSGEFRRNMALVGTPAYMAPEQAQHPDRADFRADIYSLGITLYHVTTGLLPFTADDPMKVIRMHIQDQPPRPSTPGYPKALAAMVMRMIDKDPAKRPQTYEELVADLQALLRDPTVTGGVADDTSLLGQFKRLFKNR